MIFPRGRRRLLLPFHDFDVSLAMNRKQPASLEISRVQLGAVCCFLLGIVGTSLCMQSILSDLELFKPFVSTDLAKRVLSFLGAAPTEDNPSLYWVSFAKIIGMLAFCDLVCLLVGSWWISRRTKKPFLDALFLWMLCGWVWWLIPGLWEVLRIVPAISDWSFLQTILFRLPQFWLSVPFAGWVACFLVLQTPALKKDELPSLEKGNRATFAVIGMMLIYVIVFTAMNWQLYFSLNLPHGDSAMYEEHLWNLLHGKGFRSYLDQGLFLGEHIQVAHLSLIPFYILWPSHLLLELSESMLLAVTALPLFWIVRRHTQSATLGISLAAAYLLYVPMHFLDISVDLKTFRPITFGIPAMLFGLDQLERKRWKSMLLFFVFALLAKEDFAAVIAPLGLWILFCHRRNEEKTVTRKNNAEKKKNLLLGAGLCVGTTLYLALVIVVLIPAFREGGDVHYARYFGELGNSPGDIAKSFLQQPSVVLGKLFSLRSLIYSVVLLVPLGLLPLWSPTRLLVGLPLFSVLCLLELTADPAKQGVEHLVPLHHFHAPVIPILLWSAAAGLGRCGIVIRLLQEKWFSKRDRTGNDAAKFADSTARGWGHFTWLIALASGFCLGFSPLSIGFWDSTSHVYWGNRYHVDERAKMAEHILELIPEEARVASTDYIHTRLTHYERSYDYSDFPRKVNDYKPGAPPDTDYIVIDIYGKYNTIEKPEQISEFRNHPEEWEMLDHSAKEYFIVLKRTQKFEE